MKIKKLQIRNSTAEFLIFTKQENKNTIEVRIEDETVWLTQKLMGVLFEKGRSTITEHLQNIFDTGELKETSVCRDFRHTAEDGKEYTTKFYNLDVIIAVGFRVNSERATQFRQWAINILRDFAVRGYVLDKDRLKNGSFFSKEYFIYSPKSGKSGQVSVAFTRKSPIFMRLPLTTMYLDYAEDQAEQNIPMTMEDCSRLESREKRVSAGFFIVHLSVTG
ncbi:MAG: RhuM family protein [Victivallales bacterium]